MKYTPLLAGALALLAPQFASAQDVSGGISLSYGAYLGEDDLNQTTLSGSVEVDFTRAFGLQFDVTTSGRDGTSDDLDGQAIALHSVLHFDQNSSFGFFVGQADVGFSDYTTLGLEYSWESRAGEVDVALSNIDYEDSSENATAFSISGEYDLSYAWSLTGDLKVVNSDFLDTQDIAIGTEFNFGQGGALFANLGVTNFDLNGFGDEDETYIRIGASFQFGNSGRDGATFDARGFSF